MNMELSASQTLERELEDIRRKKQEFQMLEERERLVRERLEMVKSVSSPIAINSNRPAQHGGALSVSPSGGYELVGSDGRRFHPYGANRRATVSMTPRSQSNVGTGGLSVRPDTNMAVCLALSLNAPQYVVCLAHPANRTSDHVRTSQPTHTP